MLLTRRSTRALTQSRTCSEYPSPEDNNHRDRTDSEPGPNETTQRESLEISQGRGKPTGVGDNRMKLAS